MFVLVNKFDSGRFRVIDVIIPHDAIQQVQVQLLHGTLAQVSVIVVVYWQYKMASEHVSSVVWVFQPMLHLILMVCGFSAKDIVFVNSGFWLGTCFICKCVDFGQYPNAFHM